MSAFLWWRSWHGAPMDPKWPVIASRSGVKVGIVSAVAWELMDYASQHKDRGSVEGFDTETYAVYSGFDEAEIVAVIKAMRDKKLITDDHLTNWEKRQPQREDNSTDRVREWRAMKHNETQCNAKKSPEEIRGDKDKEEIKEGDAPPISDKLNTPIFMDTWKEWLAYRKETKHQLTWRTAVKQLKMLEPHGSEIAAAMLSQSIQNGWQGIFELKQNGKVQPIADPLAGMRGPNE